LTGNLYTAKEALEAGLVSRVVPQEQVLEESIKTAEIISKYSPLIVKMAKETVNKAFETTLSQGLLFEKRVFQSTFATHDQKEGMKAFVEKRVKII
jgi:enoyl-CoA hydratase/carnithine racemase